MCVPHVPTGRSSSCRAKPLMLSNRTAALSPAQSTKAQPSLHAKEKKEKRKCRLASLLPPEVQDDPA